MSLFEGVNVISPEDEHAPEDTWCLPPVYKMSQIKRISVWQIAFDAGTSYLISKHGYIDGKIQVDTLLVNVNKSNRNIFQQAFLQARKRFNDKIDKGYSQQIPEEGINYSSINTDRGTSSRSSTGDQRSAFKPIDFQRLEFQLANQYFDSKSNPKIKNFPVECQMKIDGVRAGTLVQGNEIKIVSRNNKEFPWLELIKKELKRFYSYRPSNEIYPLDGEIYNQHLTFEQITSAVSTTNTKHPDNDKLYYFIFDIMMFNQTLEIRRKYLLDWITNYINDGNKFDKIYPVPTFVVNSHQQILEKHDEFIDDGYEGIIIRKWASSLPPGKEKQSYYTGARNDNLLKLKKYIDEEGTIIDVFSGEGREEGLALFKIQDKRGNVFDIRPNGSFENRKDWFLHPEKVIGKEYTFKYFKLTAKNIPRFPVGVGFRNYE